MLLREYLQNAYMSCIHYIVNKKLHWTERFFWFICTCLCIAACILVIKVSYSAYFDQKTAITADTNYLDWDTPFPAFSFCYFKTTKTLIQLKKILDLKIPTSIWSSGMYLMDFNTKIFSFRKAKKDSESFNIEPFYNFSYYWQLLQTDCEDQFSACYFNNIRFNCCNYITMIPNAYGPSCFTINSAYDNLYAQKIFIKQNIFANLSLEITNSYVRITPLSTTSVTSTLSSKAIKKFHGEDVSLNQIYNFFFKLTETYSYDDVKSLSIEQRACRLQTENNLKYHKTYSFEACENECVMKLQMQLCGCIRHNFWGASNENECDWKGVICIDDIMKDELAEKYKSCEYCLPACNQTEITVTGFYALNHKQRSAISFENPKSTSRINFIVAAPKVRYIRSIVKDRYALISSIGSILGLFLGFSLMTIVQLIYYIFVRPAFDFRRYLSNLRRHKYKPPVFITDRKLLNRQYNKVQPKTKK